MRTKVNRVGRSLKMDAIFAGDGTSDLAATSSCSRCKKYE